jgi:hypothetical protein
MRRFTTVMLILIAIVWLLKLLLPEPKPRLTAAVEPRTFTVAPLDPAHSPYATPVHVVSKARAPHKIGPCQKPDDRTADGSPCGNRVASVRPGGK